MTSPSKISGDAVDICSRLTDKTAGNDETAAQAQSVSAATEIKRILPGVISKYTPS